MSIRESWKRIVDWHKRSVPEGKFRLAKAVRKGQFAAFEAELGILLPADVRESYLLHDGTAGTWLLYFGEVMSLDGIKAMWRRYGDWQAENGYGLGADWQPDDIEGPIKPIWWSPLRIPITDNGGGDPVMIDLDPNKGGERGQIIKFNHEGGPIKVLAPNFAHWLDKIASELEAGQHRYNEIEGMVHPITWKQ